MSKKGRYFSLLIVFFAGVFLSISLSWYAYNGERTRIKAALDEAAINRIKYIEDTIGDAIDTLGSFGDLYAASNEVEEQEFDTFAQGIFERKPFIFEIRWLKRVKENERKDFEQAMRNNGAADFMIYDLSQDGSKIEAGRRPEYLPILYNSVSPLHLPKHLRISGLDIEFIPERWQALQLARDTGKIAIVSETRQFEEEAVATASRIFLPVYRNGIPHNTLTERRENLIGFVALLYRIDELVESAIRGAPLVGVNIVLYEFSSGEKKILYVRPARTEKSPVNLDLIAKEAEKGNYFTFSGSFEVANQKWLLVCNPSRFFLAQHKIILPWIVLVIGILITILLTFYLNSIVNRDKVIERLVLTRTEQLRKAEAKYRIIYESSQDAIMTLAPPGWNFTAGNPASIKMFGAKDEKEFISRNPGELSPEYQPDGELSSVKSKKMIAQAMENGSNLFEWTHKRINGEEFLAEVLLSRIDSESGQFLQATVRDITAAKKSEEEFRRLSDFNTAILNTLPFPMDIVNENGDILFLSEKMQAVTGKDALGKKCWSIYRDDKEQCSDCPLIKGILIGQTEAIESSGVFGGRTFQISHTGMLFNGQKAILEIFKDITQQKQDEDALKARTAELERINKIMVGREMRMMELKKEIEELKRKITHG